YEDLKVWFESREKGSGSKLDQFLAEAEYKYNVGINDLVYRPGRKLTEFLDVRIIGGLVKLQLLGDISTHIRKYFKDPLIIELLEFPVLFLGERASKTPALYSLMNYADIKLGTWYPEGGMFEIVKALQSLAIEKGVEVHCSTQVKDFNYERKRIHSVNTNKGVFECDVVISGADYHHTD
ncbi:MAG: phytoene desaturase family protein, partial [Flavobacteriales bacterium]